MGTGLGESCGSTCLERTFFAAGAGDEGAREFNEIVLEVLEVGGVLNVGDFVPALRWLDPQGVVGRMKKLHRRFDDMMNGIIADSRKARATPAAGEESKDLLGLLLSMVVDDERPSAGGDEVRITETDVKALILVSSRFQSNHVLAFWPQTVEPK